MLNDSFPRSKSDYSMAFILPVILTRAFGTNLFAMNWGPRTIHTQPILFISFIYPYVWAGPNFLCYEQSILSKDVTIAAFTF